MPDVGGGDTSRQGFQVAYHGDSSDDHSLDVEALAPFLLGFGRLVRESNSLLNGDKVRVKILVTSDFEHKCFHINFEVVQTARKDQDVPAGRPRQNCKRVAANHRCR